MKRVLLFAFFVSTVMYSKAQLKEDISSAPVGYVLSSGPNVGNVNSNSVTNTSGTGGDNPENRSVPSSRPVSLINFNSNRNGSYVTLQWTTTIENNNTGFEIQRSTGNGGWEKAGFVATKASGGNSDIPLNYQYKEENTAGGNTVYRLVQINKFDMHALTAVKSVYGMDEESDKITVYRNSGTSGNMKLVFGSSIARNVSIIDMNGKVVERWNNCHKDNMVINGLRSGIYILVITNKITREKQKQVIVVK